MNIRPYRQIERRKSRKIKVGSVFVGGDAPITVQTMTNTKTTDIEATLEQIYSTVEAGVDIVRVSCPDKESTSALKEIIKLGKQLKLPIIEDNCEAIGGKFSNNYYGTIGDIGVMSFDHGKMIATGEGGMVLTNSGEYADYIRSYIDHGHMNDHLRFLFSLFDVSFLSCNFGFANNRYTVY